MHTKLKLSTTIKEVSMIPKHRKPTHPGEILWEDFLKPMEMTQQQLANKMGVPVQRINTLINGKRGVTPETAILLSRTFGTTPELWMHLQASYDLYIVKMEMDDHAA